MAQSPNDPDESVKLMIPISGPLATELRRIANNLSTKPYVIARELLREGLEKKYGITVK